MGANVTNAVIDVLVNLGIVRGNGSGGVVKDAPSLATDANGNPVLVGAGSTIPLLLKSVTTVYRSVTSDMLVTNSIIPFNLTLRDDLGVSDVDTNAGRILIPASAKRMRVSANVLCTASQGGTYRRMTMPIVVNSTQLSAITDPPNYGTCQNTNGVFSQSTGLQVVSAEFDLTGWGITADDGNSYVETKIFHDGTAGAGNQITVTAGSFMSVEFWS